jgi:hydroxyethylthiazole kinase-like sugar kinase family protein
MSEAFLIAIVGSGCTLLGGSVTAWVNHHNHHEDTQTTSSGLLIQAQNQLTAAIETEQLLWQWNRALIDHIYRQCPPPPPEPPAGLFERGLQ